MYVEIQLNQCESQYKVLPTSLVQQGMTSCQQYEAEQHSEVRAVGDCC